MLDLLSAYQDIATSKTNPHLYIVGQGAEASACKALAEKCPNLHVVGSKPLSEIPTWLAACDGLVLPSWAEGTPNVLLEAQACGRRVVATSVGGIPDVIHDPKLGILCPPKSPRKLGAAILELLSSSYAPDEVARIGDQQSWPQSAKQLFDVLASIAP